MKPVVVLLCIAQDGVCFFCGAQFTGPVPIGSRHPPQTSWTRDHLWPRSAGGGLPFNTVLACVRCNRAKGSRYPTEPEIARARALYERIDRVGRAVMGRQWTWPEALGSNGRRCAPGAEIGTTGCGAVPNFDDRKELRDAPQALSAVDALCPAAV